MTKPIAWMDGTQEVGQPVLSFYCPRRTEKRSYAWWQMLIAAFIFVFSLASAIQFVVLSWRAGLLKIAAEQLSPEWEPVAEPMAKSMIANGFSSLAAYSDLCPDLGGAPKFRSLRLYYRALEMMDTVIKAVSPQNLGWTNREMALCTRVAAVMLSHRLEQTQALSAAARSF